jgi:hypothetical protein
MTVVMMMITDRVITAITVVMMMIIDRVITALLAYPKSKPALRTKARLLGSAHTL